MRQVADSLEERAVDADACVFHAWRGPARAVARSSRTGPVAVALECLRARRSARRRIATARRPVSSTPDSPSRSSVPSLHVGRRGLERQEAGTRSHSGGTPPRPGRRGTPMQRCRPKAFARRRRARASGSALKRRYDERRTPSATSSPPAKVTSGSRRRAASRYEHTGSPSSRWRSESDASNALPRPRPP